MRKYTTSTMWVSSIVNTTVTQNYGTTYSVANNATRTGYIFGGWKVKTNN